MNRDLRLPRPLLVIFSLWVWSVGFCLMALTVVLSAILLPIVPFRKSHMWIARPLMSLCLMITFSRFRVIYHPRYDPKRLSMFNGNHVSAFDAHMLCRVIRLPICGVTAAASMTVPIYGWVMRLSQGIPVWPQNSGRTAEISAAARDRIGQGIAIAAYAEGGRTLDGKVGPYKRGTFFMARDAGIPVVPVVTRGMYELLPKGSWLVQPSDITVYVHEQIETDGLSDDEVGELAERFRDIVVDYAEHGRLPQA